MHIMTQLPSYKVIALGDYVRDKIHTRYAVNNGQLLLMNVLQAIFPKSHDVKIASPINTSST